MKNIETPDKTHLGRLLEELRYGKYVIPDFQREFEWEPWDITELIRSIFEDYYIGTLLLWKVSKENLEVLKCEPIYGFDGSADPQHIVLDGQQRLSALYYTFFAPDKPFPRRKSRCFFFINLREILDENFDDAFSYEWESKRIIELLENRERQFEEKIFPLSIFKESPHAWLKWVEGYEDYRVHKTDPETAKRERDKIEYLIEDLISNYDVSFIELDRDIEISKVCDIFARINSTGVDLTIFDLLNAMLRPQNIFLKDMWRGVAEKFNVAETKKMRVYLLQIMSILKQGYCSPRYLHFLIPGVKKTIKLSDGSTDQTVLISSKEEFVRLWDFVVEKAEEAVEMLENPRDFGAIKPKFVPYPSMIPILTAINIERGSDNYPDKRAVENKIRRWYWSSIFTKNYSSSVESQTTKDFYALQKWFKNDEDVPQAVARLRNEIDNLDLESETKQGSAVYKAIFDILILRGARDWNTFTLPEYSTLEDHHIVPKSWGKKHVGDAINSILNRTPISDDTNKVIIGSQLPNVYLREMLKRAGNKEDIFQLLETHLIPRNAAEILLREDFSEEDYREFIQIRERAILDEIKSISGIDTK